MYNLIQQRNYLIGLYSLYLRAEKREKLRKLVIILQIPQK